MNYVRYQALCPQSYPPSRFYKVKALFTSIAYLYFFSQRPSPLHPPIMLLYPIPIPIPHNNSQAYKPSPYFPFFSPKNVMNTPTTNLFPSPYQNLYAWDYIQLWRFTLSRKFLVLEFLVSKYERCWVKEFGRENSHTCEITIPSKCRAFHIDFQVEKYLYGDWSDDTNLTD